MGTVVDTIFYDTDDVFRIRHYYSQSFRLTVDTFFLERDWSNPTAINSISFGIGKIKIVQSLMGNAKVTSISIWHAIQKNTLYFNINLRDIGRSNEIDAEKVLITIDENSFISIIRFPNKDFLRYVLDKDKLIFEKIVFDSKTIPRIE